MPTHYLDMDPTDPLSLPGKGDIPCDYAIVGIAPSPNRNYQTRNEPFGAKSYAALGRVLTMADKAAFYRSKGEGDDLRPAVYITNLIRQPLPPGKKPTKLQVAHGYPRLLRELQLVTPKRVLAMGTPVAAVLCPGFKNMREDHGTLFYNPTLGCIVVPCYHFSAAARSPLLKPIMGRDLQRFFTLPDPEAPPFTVVTEIDSPFPEYGRVVLDIETTGLDPWGDEIKLLGILHDDPRFQPYAQIMVEPTKLHLKILYRHLKRHNCTLVGHNLSFDLGFLEAKGGFHWDVEVEDTMVMAKVQGEEVLALKHLSTMYTDRPGSRAFGGIEDQGYLAEDLFSTRDLYHFLDQRENGPPTFSRQLMNSVIPEVVGMRERGVFIDRSLIAEVKEHTGSRITEFYSSIVTSLEKMTGKSKAGINLNSTQQLVSAFLEAGISLEKRTKKGAFSVDEEVLLALAAKEEIDEEEDRIASLILEYREQTKLMSFLTSYAEKSSEDHPYLHPRIKMLTRTGRWSMEEPNLQQVTRIGPLKLMFKSRWPGGKYGLVDLSQAELRCVCYLSDDDVMAEALLTGDPHAQNAAIAYKKPESEVSSKERKKVKGVTFGVLYGGSPPGLAKRVGVGVTEVKTILTTLFGRFKKLKRWYDATWKEGVETGWISNHFGRKRDLRAVLAIEGDNSAGRKAVNTPVQGLASEVNVYLLRFISVQLRVRRLKTRPLFPVHDSIILEVYPGEQEAVTLVVQDAFLALKDTPLSTLPMFYKLPIVGEFIIGDTWAQVESTNEHYAPDSLHPCSSLPELDFSGGRGH